MGLITSAVITHLASQMVYYVWHWHWFQNQSASYNIGHTTHGLCWPHQKRQNQWSEWTTKNRMLQVNIQSLLHGTRFGLDHQRKPVENEIFLQRPPSLFECDRKENIKNKRNILTVTPIKYLILEVAAEPFAAPNVLTVDVFRTPQHCLAKLSRQQESKSASYFKTSSMKERQRLLWTRKWERWGIKHRTYVDCRWKHHDLRDMIFAVIFFHFYIF